ncbi:MAG: hypothetical protein EBU90_29070 [Proteobacteria bacterium]|nr:hypothetical protein [Pseudomonadota bacterium]
MSFSKEVEILIESYLKGNPKDPEDLETFITKRSEGAKKIQHQAEAKGKFSTLTAIHFKAKEKPYKEAHKAAKSKDSKTIKEKASSCYKKLASWKTMSQRDFQHVMGELEAYGEVFIRMREDKA